MGSPYSEDLRERVVGSVASGLSCNRAAKLFRIGVSTAIGWTKRWRETGSVAAKPMGGDQSSRIRDEDAAWVLALVRSSPDLTLAEIGEALRRGRGLEVSISVVWRFLDKHGLRFKKNTARRRARTP